MNGGGLAQYVELEHVMYWWRASRIVGATFSRLSLLSNDAMPLCMCDPEMLSSRWASQFLSCWEQIAMLVALHIIIIQQTL